MPATQESKNPFLESTHPDAASFARTWDENRAADIAANATKAAIPAPPIPVTPPVPEVGLPLQVPAAAPAAEEAEATNRTAPSGSAGSVADFVDNTPAVTHRVLSLAQSRRGFIGLVAGGLGVLALRRGSSERTNNATTPTAAATAKVSPDTSPTAVVQDPTPTIAPPPTSLPIERPNLVEVRTGDSAIPEVGITVDGSWHGRVGRKIISEIAKAYIDRRFEFGFRYEGGVAVEPKIKVIIEDGSAKLSDGTQLELDSQNQDIDLPILDTGASVIWSGEEWKDGRVIHTSPGSAVELDSHVYPEQPDSADPLQFASELPLNDSEVQESYKVGLLLNRYGASILRIISPASTRGIDWKVTYESGEIGVVVPWDQYTSPDHDYEAFINLTRQGVGSIFDNLENRRSRFHRETGKAYDAFIEHFGTIKNLRLSKRLPQGHPVRGGTSGEPILPGYLRVFGVDKLGRYLQASDDPALDTTNAEVQFINNPKYLAELVIPKIIYDYVNLDKALQRLDFNERKVATALIGDVLNVLVTEHGADDLLELFSQSTALSEKEIGVTPLNKDTIDGWIKDATNFPLHLIA